MGRPDCQISKVLTISSDFVTRFLGRVCEASNIFSNSWGVSILRVLTLAVCSDSQPPVKVRNPRELYFYKNFRSHIPVDSLDSPLWFPPPPPPPQKTQKAAFFLIIVP